MANWEKLSKEFDDKLNSMTKEDWDNWYVNVEQKRINQNNMFTDLQDAEDFMSVTDKLIATPKTVGGYRLGDEKAAATLHLTKRPKWLHRKMMKLCFGVEWVDDKQ